jgi:hypothetical protein
MSEVISIIVGFILGALVSWVFYLCGRADADIAHLRAQMFSAIFRLKQMTPTCRNRVEGGFGTYETENYFTCLAETVRLSEWPEGADALMAVVEDLQNVVHYENPNETQRAEGETKKKEWEAHLYRQIQEVGHWQSRLRLALPSWIRNAT